MMHAVPNVTQVPILKFSESSKCCKQWICQTKLSVHKTVDVHLSPDLFVSCSVNLQPQSHVQMQTTVHSGIFLSWQSRRPYCTLRRPRPSPVRVTFVSTKCFELWIPALLHTFLNPETGPQWPWTLLLFLFLGRPTFVVIRFSMY